MELFENASQIPNMDCINRERLEVGRRRSPAMKSFAANITGLLSAFASQCQALWDPKPGRPLQQYPALASAGKLFFVRIAMWDAK